MIVKISNLNQRIYGFSFAQSLALTTATMSVAMSAIVGSDLSSNDDLSTLPYGAQFLGIVLFSYLLSMCMKRYGRKPVFVFAGVCFIFAGLLGACSTHYQSFWLNAFAHLVLGIAISGCAYFRFAVTDGLIESAKARALSIVTFGGIFAAFIGPNLVAGSRTYFTSQFTLSYLIISIIGVILILLILVIPNLDNESSVHKSKHSDESLLAGNSALTSSFTPNKFPLIRFLSAIYASGFGYMLMGMLMMQSSLLLNKLGYDFALISIVIQCHVVAMFLPSLFIGKVIDRYGANSVIMAGYLVMLLSIILAINYSGYLTILIALVGIGVGWNFLYVGGSSLVATMPGNASQLQGINETAVGVLQTLGAFSAGVLFSQIGWVNSNYFAIYLLLPGLALLIIDQFTRRKVVSKLI